MVLRGLARRVVFLGPPGSGKGSYGKICAKMMGVPHLSTGDMLRAEVEAGSRLGHEAASCLAAGAMVDDTLLRDVLSGVLAPGGAGAGASGFLLDGFPRSVAQARELFRQAQEDAEKEVLKRMLSTSVDLKM